MPDAIILSLSPTPSLVEPPPAALSAARAAQRMVARYLAHPAITSERITIGDMRVAGGTATLEPPRRRHAAEAA